MTKKLSLCLFAVIMILGIGLNAAIKELVILHTNDVHGHVLNDEKRGSIGMAKISYYAKNLKAEGHSVLLLNAGDAVTGTPLSEFTEGIAIYDIMSKAGYDAGTLGNHEYDLGWEHIHTHLSAAKFPLVCANAYTPEDALQADGKYVIKNVNGLKVGIIGLLTCDTPNHIIHKNNEGVWFSDEVKTLNELVPKLRKKCDIVMLLTHNGYDEDVRIAGEVKNVDIVVGGHSHTDLNKPTITVTGARVVQAHEFSKALGEINLTYDTEKKDIIKFSWKKLRDADLEGSDDVIERAINLWKSKLPAEIYSVIGQVPREYSRAEFKEIIENYLAEEATTDFGYMNQGGVRDKLYYPEVLERDIWIALPFDNQLSIISIKGKNIGGDMKKDLTERGVEIDPEKVYTVATNTFVSQAPKAEMGEPVEKVEVMNKKIRDVVIDSIRANPNIVL
ncbi:MAG: bifunctional metallophosphatase/5'-nucleotidase [Lentisphaerae bacterium]|nr:bifunctional metallophosphatase/5'-nucleotidase [Lentisphaerota bacterium]MCP4102994.1 bifunctional metallophosphatase/5'-nucleotidase [Lentisphaerota bacterium]